MFALCGHALTPLAMGRPQVSQVHFPQCVILHTSLFLYQGLSLPVLPAGTHTPLPSTTPVRGTIPFCVSGAERALSQAVLASDTSGFSGDQQIPRLEVATSLSYIK